MIGKVRPARGILPLVAAAGAVAIALAGCGGGAPASGDGGSLSVSISEPAANATVTVPFTATVAASVPLGTTDTGLHHVHIWFDDNESAYQVVESTTVTITDVPPGPHVMHVSLRNANHSPAGAQTQVPITVGAPAGLTASPAATPAASQPEPPYAY